MKHCYECVHYQVCKLLDNLYLDNFKWGILLANFFDIYKDSNLADKCIHYKEVIKEND